MKQLSKQINNAEARFAYLAAVIDCDGSFTLVKENSQTHCKNIRYEFRIVVTNTNKEFLEAIKNEFGGHVRVQNKSNGVWKTSYRWTSSSKKIEEIAWGILPFLIIKKRQAELLLEFRKTVDAGRKTGGNGMGQEIRDKRESIYWEMKKLNKRGVELVRGAKQ